MGAGASHRIGRQVLEVSGGERDQARALGDAMHALYVERLLPVIDEACTALADGDRLVRVERLEIDLGALPWDEPAALRALAAERLAQALPEQLRAAAAPLPSGSAELELLERFALSGTLPWWADPADRGLVGAAIDRLLAAPEAARSLHRRLAGRPDAWRRLLPHGSDLRWDAWLGLALPDWQPLAGAPMQALAEAAGAGDGTAATGAAARAVAERWWPPLLADLGRGASSGDAGAVRLIGDALAGLARQGDRDAAALWRGWRETLARHGATLGAIGAALDRRFGATPAAPTAAQLAPAPNVPARLLASDAAADAAAAAQDAGLAERFASWAAGGTAARMLWARLAATLPRLPPTLRRAAAGSLAPQHTAALVDAALAQGLLAPERVDDWIAAASAASATTPATVPAPPRDALASALLPLLRALPRQSDPAAPLLDDTLVVGNAGLVLLWPFLASLFERLGLVVERRFGDELAAQRGARLLHFVASGDPEAAEYQLPLPKLLCGLDLIAPIDDDEPLPQAMRDEAEAMLRAVVARAPVLRDMSIDGLRGSFLLRRGQLAARDGHWLLRVERESWDLVIERFPWSAGIVRLPWMDTLLEVQW